MAPCSEPFPRSDEKKEQHGRQLYNERGADQRRAFRCQRIRERILEDVKPHTKKDNYEEAGKAPEGAYEPAANDQGLGRAHTRSVMDNPATHRSILRRIPVGERLLGKF